MGGGGVLPVVQYLLGIKVHPTLVPCQEATPYIFGGHRGRGKVSDELEHNEKKLRIRPLAITSVAIRGNRGGTLHHPWTWKLYVHSLAMVHDNLPRNSIGGGGWEGTHIALLRILDIPNLRKCN